MATLTNKTIASTYTSLLKLEGDTGSTVAAASGAAVQVKTGDNDATPLYLNTDMIGIGTNAPESALHIGGSGAGILTLGREDTAVIDGEFLGVIQFAADDPVDGTYQIGASINCLATDTWDDGDHPTEITFKTTPDGGTNQVQAMMIGSNGRVGIGTATPDVKVDVEGSSAPTMRIGTTLTANDDAAMGTLAFGNGTDSQLVQIVASQDGANDSGKLKINVEETGEGPYTAMTIKSDGKIGMGTTSPAMQLHISHSSPARVMISREDTTIVADEEIGRVSFAGDSPTNATYKQGCCIMAVADGEWGTSGDSTDSPARLEFYTVPDGSDTLTERMQIDKDGNVGIGVTPTYPFDVKASPSSNYAARIWSDGGASTDYGLLLWAGSDSPGSDGDCRWIALADGDGTAHANIQYKHTGTTAEISAVSDERLKENVKDTSINGLDAINSLSFKEYNWTENSHRGQSKIPIGLVAQEVIVAGDKCNIVSKFEDEMILKDGSKITDVQGIGYNGILLYLAKAVQELSAKVTALESK